jgi:Flp pilus assembly protein TadB
VKRPVAGGPRWRPAGDEPAAAGRLPRQVTRVETGKADGRKPRVGRRRRTSAGAALARKLDRWLRRKPKRAAYWTGVLHGVVGTLLVVGASYIMSLLGTVLVVILALGAGWMVRRRA